MRISINNFSFAKDYLLSLFPELPSYQTFNYKLNLLSEAFKVLSKRLIESFMPIDCDINTSLVDSMLVIICGGRNPSEKVVGVAGKSRECCRESRENDRGK